jgi:hypothetical protein
VMSAPEIIVTLGPCDDMRAEIFVRPAGDVPAGSRIVGSVTGPRRGRDTTLPVTSRLVPLAGAAAAGPASRAILTEPAYWTPDLPNLYRVEARLEPHDGDPWAIDAWIGLRRLGVRGRSFWLDGRRWVPRAFVGQHAVAAAKEAEVGLAITMPADPLLAEADDMGVGVVPLLPAASLTPTRIASWARHPSAMLAVITGGDAMADVADRLAAGRGARGTLLIGMAVDGMCQPPAVPAGVDFLVVQLPAEGLPHAGWMVPAVQPLVAWRQAAEKVSSRASCDALQRDLALWRLTAGAGLAGGTPPWDWAGYLVG